MFEHLRAPVGVDLFVYVFKPHVKSDRRLSKSHAGSLASARVLIAIGLLDGAFQRRRP